MRLDECQSAFLSVKLKYLELWTNQRRQIAFWYEEMLSGIGDLILPITAKNSTHVYHLYVVRSQKRNELQQYLLKNGIGTLIHYPVPPHLQKAYEYLGFQKGDFPVAEIVADTCLSLPVWPGMKKEEVDFIGKTTRDFFNGK